MGMRKSRCCPCCDTTAGFRAQQTVITTSSCVTPADVAVTVWKGRQTDSRGKRFCGSEKMGISGIIN